MKIYRGYGGGGAKLHAKKIKEKIAPLRKVGRGEVSRQEEKRTGKKRPRGGEKRPWRRRSA